MTGWIIAAILYLCGVVMFTAIAHDASSKSRRSLRWSDWAVIMLWFTLPILAALGEPRQRGGR